VLGYQKGTTQAFYATKKDIDEVYVDGVSITYGYPREHLWTYAAGYTAKVYNYYYNCPCSSTNGYSPPSFVRNNYYCEAGAPSTPTSTTYYTDNILWDGKGCPIGNSCCSQLQMPYFYRRLPVETAGNVNSIEVRICQRTSFATAATLVEEMEIYVGKDV